MINQSKLIDRLRDATLAAKTNSEIATELSAQVLTPKADKITAVSLGLAWGGVRAATFWAALTAASQGNTQPLAALANYAISLLGSNGVDASNAQVQELAGAFVQAGLCTQSEINSLFYNASYPCDDVVTVDDVAAARASLALEVNQHDRRQQLANAYNATVTFIDAHPDATAEQVMTAFSEAY